MNKSCLRTWTYLTQCTCLRTWTILTLCKTCLRTWTILTLCKTCLRTWTILTQCNCLSTQNTKRNWHMWHFHRPKMKIRIISILSTQNTITNIIAHLNIAPVYEISIIFGEPVTRIARSLIKTLELIIIKSELRLNRFGIPARAPISHHTIPL